MLNTRELFVEFDRCLAICLCGYFWGIERSKVNSFPVESNLGYPLSLFGIKVNSLVAAFVVFTNSLIMLLLSAIGNSKIAINIIESIAVFVVSFARVSVCKAKDAAMHVFDTIPVGRIDVTGRVKLVHAYVIEGIPRKTRILGIQARTDSRHHATTQLDFTVGWFRGCHGLSNQRFGVSRDCNPDTLIVLGKAA